MIPVRHSHVLTTDASSHGWGGWWRRVGFKPSRQDEARGFFLHKESRMSSNSRELHAILYSVMAAAPRLRRSIVLVETGNLTKMAYVNHLGGRSRFLSAVAHRLWRVTKPTPTGSHFGQYTAPGPKTGEPISSAGGGRTPRI